MSIEFPGFIGPSYAFEDRYAAIERTVNWYLIANESSEESKFKFAFAPSPSNVPFSPLPVPPPFNQPNRGLLECRGIVYGVNGDRVFSISINGAFSEIGMVQNDNNPVSMVANGIGQIFVASAGLGYVIPAGGAPGSLVQVVTPEFLGARYATFQDGYIIVASTTPASAINQFQVSGSVAAPVGNALAWDSTQIVQLTGQADRLVALISSREYLRLLGSRRTQVFQNIGVGSPPFASYNENFIETGCGAAYSLVDMGDSLMWIGEDARGQRACWRDAAFRPERASNFAVEQFWQTYTSIADAIAFPYIWKGHLMYQITFPSAVDAAGAPTTKTWVYDATVSQLIGKPSWHERQYLNVLNTLVGRPELFHAYAYGKHLVGSGGADGNPGAIYQYSDTVYTDAGSQFLGPGCTHTLYPFTVTVTDAVGSVVHIDCSIDVLCP